MKIKYLPLMFAALISSTIFSENKVQMEPIDKTENEQGKIAYQSLKPYHFRIQMKNYMCATFFEIDSDDTYVGNIKKSDFRLSDNYDLSDRDGWCATGVRRIFSLGSLYNWAAEIDIQGVHGEKLGFIEGKILTTALAKFNIYDRYDHLVAVAYMDLDNKGVTLTPPNNETYPLARLNRIYVPNIPDHWEVVVYEPKDLDDRIIRIFAAFCVDVQDSFHKDI